jgi:phosphate starvation-inducible PhoH-like protein
MQKRKHKKDFNQHYQTVTNIEDYRSPPKKRHVEITPRNEHQEDYLDLLLDPEVSIILATGPAGTGKTLLAMQAAIKALKEKQCNKIVVTRPAVGVENEKHGFLPGDLNRKMEPWTKPLFDVLHEYYTPKDVLSMMENDVIEICPLAFMRGRNFHHCYIIFDEAQNATINQIKMAMTRVGNESKMIITGDLAQKDKQFYDDNGLSDFLVRLEETPSNLIGTVKFGAADIERHPVVREVLRLYGEED